MDTRSFTVYAQWAEDEHCWMVLDDATFQPVIQAETPADLVDAYERRLEEEARVLTVARLAA